MATTQIVKVKIEALTKYGFKANDRYVGLSKNLSEADKTKLVPGAEFEAEYYIADSGKEYLNKVLSQKPTTAIAPVVATAPTDVDTERAKKFTPKFTKKVEAAPATMSKGEWAAKDRRISRQGCIQVAVQVVADFDQAKALADKMLDYVNG